VIFSPENDAGSLTHRLTWGRTIKLGRGEGRSQIFDRGARGEREMGSKKYQTVFFTGRTSCLGQIFQKPLVVIGWTLYLPTGEIVKIDYE
jgi:hypothetical protein